MTFALRFGDLFSGAGGLSLGFILSQHPRVTFHPLFAIDKDPYSLNSLQTSFSWLSTHTQGVLPVMPKVFERDIDTLNTSALMRLLQIHKGDLDLLLGGPPCQGYSSANRQSESAQRSAQNRMSKVFLDRLEEIYPKMFLLENVQGVKWTDPTSDMNINGQLALFDQGNINLSSVQSYLIERTRRAGYCVWYGVLNAVEYGVPQTRYRFFLFGVRQDIAQSEESISLAKHLKWRKAPIQVNVSTAISDLPELVNGQNWQGDYHPSTSSYVNLMRRFMQNGELHDHFTTNHADYVIERFQNIPQGGNWESIRSMMSTYSNIDNTHSNIYRRLDASKPAITISHYRKSMIVHPTQDRGISFREACRLQSFPDWFRFLGPVDERQQQLANAVPPLLASQIAYAIAQCWIDLHPAKLNVNAVYNFARGN